MSDERDTHMSESPTTGGPPTPVRQKTAREVALEAALEQERQRADREAAAAAGPPSEHELDWSARHSTGGPPLWDGGVQRYPTGALIRSGWRVEPPADPIQRCRLQLRWAEAHATRLAADAKELALAGVAGAGGHVRTFRWPAERWGPAPAARDPYTHAPLVSAALERLQ